VAQPAAPKPPVTLFEENFEHGVGSTPVALPDYTGERGTKYTADPQWLTGCNGVIVQGDAPDSEQAASGCAASSFTGVRDLAKDLGEVDGSGDSNHAVTAYTENNPGADKVQFDELGAKDGWSFTDKLSPGLVVASSAHSTDCPGADVTAAEGSSDIKAKGDLAEGMAECEITLTVRARPGTYDNGRANLTVVGLDRPPADKPAVVHFASVPVTG
jgi:hypothetical protein